MDNGYYYSRDGQRFGPVPVGQLRQLAAAGQLRPTDLIWTQGMPTWEPASKAQGLFPAGAAASAQASPPQPSEPPPHPTGTSGTRTAGDNARQLGAQAKEAAVAAGTDALKALKALLRNPVGGMREAFDLLGPGRAMVVGIVFAVMFYVCVLIGARIMFGPIIGHFSHGEGFGLYLRLAFLALVPIGTAIGGCAATRAIFKGQGDVKSDIFIAGASLLPAGVGILLMALLGLLNAEISTVVMIFAFTTAILMLYSGCTTIQKIPEAATTLAVPLMLAADFIVLEIIIKSMASPL